MTPLTAGHIFMALQNGAKEDGTLRWNGGDSCVIQGRFDLRLMAAELSEVMRQPLSTLEAKVERLERQINDRRSSTETA